MQELNTSKKLEIETIKQGRLTIIGLSEPKVYPYGSYKMVICKCECGNEITTRLSKVLSGWTKSCGCIQKEKVSSRNHVHGGSRDILYVIWCGMKQRCFYAKHVSFKYYGGGGIKMSKDWEDYNSFRSDMVGSYRAGLTLDRKDVNGDYCKENCRWATWVEQANNKRKNVAIK